jgi:hypothetical protein
MRVRYFGHVICVGGLSLQALGLGTEQIDLILHRGLVRGGEGGVEAGEHLALADNAALSHVDTLDDGLVEGLHDDIGRVGDQLAFGRDDLVDADQRTGDEHRDDQEEDEEIDRARQRRHRTGDDRGRRAFEFQHRKRQRAPARRFAVSCPA